jgi:methyltransferase (TIGR00027 family)
MNAREIDPTCLLTAALRAKESERPNRLYEDAFASRLTDDTGRRFLADIEALTPEPGARPCTVNFNAIRTRLFDQFLVDAVHRRGIRQVVLMAAGLDTRALRLEWPVDLAWFELDRSAVLEYKWQRLGTVERRARYAAVGADLTADWSALLTDAGFDANQPTAWLVEGLLYYFHELQVEAFLGQVARSSAPGSVLAADLVNSTGVDGTHPLTKSMASIYDRWGVRWRYGVDEPEAVLSRHGFDARVLQPGDPDASFGRWSPSMPPRSVPHVPRAFFVFGERSRVSST